MTKIRNVTPANAVREMLKASGADSQEIAARMGREYSYLRNYINGTEEPSVSILAETCEASGFALAAVGPFRKSPYSAIRMSPNRRERYLMTPNESTLEVQRARAGAAAALRTMLDMSGTRARAADISRKIGKWPGYMSRAMKLERSPTANDFTLMANALGYRVMILEPKGEHAFNLVPIQYVASASSL